MIEMTEQLSEQVSVSRACEVMGVPRSTLYRSRQGYCQMLWIGTDSVAIPKGVSPEGRGDSSPVDG